MNEAISKLKKCGMHTAIILGLMFALRSTAHANENMAVLQKVHDKKSDSVFVVLFYEANGNENEDEGDEMMGDFSYHVGEAFKKIKKWRLIEVNSKNDRLRNRKSIHERNHAISSAHFSFTIIEVGFSELLIGGAIGLTAVYRGGPSEWGPADEPAHRSPPEMASGVFDSIRISSTARLPDYPRRTRRWSWCRTRALR
jgi:hypothetical protein